MEQAAPNYFDGSNHGELQASVEQEAVMDEAVRRVISCNPFPCVETEKLE